MTTHSIWVPGVLGVCLPKIVSHKPYLGISFCVPQLILSMSYILHLYSTTFFKISRAFPFNILSYRFPQKKLVKFLFSASVSLPVKVIKLPARRETEQAEARGVSCWNDNHHILNTSSVSGAVLDYPLNLPSSLRCSLCCTSTITQETKVKKVSNQLSNK